MSFKDSKIAAAANSAMTLSAELAVDTEEYTLCTDGRYEVYTKYQDNAYSTVDNLKNIAVDATQINIMQEENSQYMPFRIPRYWDGMDLMDMLIQIRYESVAEKKGKVATVINVASNNTYIRFGWLIDAAVTANADNIAAITTRVTTAEGKITALEKDLAAEKPKIAKNTSDITALKGLVGDGYEAIPSASIKGLFSA